MCQFALNHFCQLDYSIERRRFDSKKTNRLRFRKCTDISWRFPTAPYSFSSGVQFFFKWTLLPHRPSKNAINFGEAIKLLRKWLIAPNNSAKLWFGCFGDRDTETEAENGIHYTDAVDMKLQKPHWFCPPHVMRSFSIYMSYSMVYGWMAGWMAGKLLLNVECDWENRICGNVGMWKTIQTLHAWA